MYKAEPGEVVRGPRFPVHIFNEMISAMLVLGMMVVLAGYFPGGLQAPADPFKTPAGAKPEWYFMALYELLRVIPDTVFGHRLFWLGNKAVIVILVGLGLLAVMLVPWLDRSDPKLRHPLKRPFATALAIFGVIAFIALTILGMMAE